MGICPLYIGWDEQGTTYFSSELKALDTVCSKIEEFPPGSYYIGSRKELVKWYDPKWAHAIPTEKVSLKKLKNPL